MATIAGREIEAIFLRWMYLRSTFHRGYVLASSLYFVVTAHLSASQIVLLGTIISVVLLLTDVPVGAWADSIGRKWPRIIGQLFLAVSMTMTGLVRTFPLLLAAQALWGFGWAFLNGADTAWLTDELNEPRRIARVLTASARRDLAGGATGMVAFGVLARVTSLSAAIVASGIAMAMLALLTSMKFEERNFTPTREDRWATTMANLRRGVGISRRDHEILLMFLATLLINCAFMVGWLYPKRLITLGFPNNPVLWYTALLVLASVLGFLALRFVEARIDGAGVARRFYMFACIIGTLGLAILTFAPNALLGGIGVLLAKGVADSVTRPISVIWVNRRTASDIRATVHSLLSQAESSGEILGGLALAGIAQVSGMSTTLAVAGTLILITGIMVGRSRVDRAKVQRRVA